MSATDCPACDGLGCIPASPGERARICDLCGGVGQTTPEERLLYSIFAKPKRVAIDVADELAAKRDADDRADQAAEDEAMRRER